MHAKRNLLVAIAIVVAALCAACSSGGGGATVSDSAVVYDPQALPSGPLGDEIREGHEIIVHTQQRMKGFVGADISCAACHINAGTKPRGGTFVGTYAHFPQWNQRAHRVITLQDRLAECFLYSENGRPPAYSSKEMVAMVAYIAWLSRDVPTLSSPLPKDSFIVPLPAASPNIARGAALYAQQCATCHQANGRGIAGTFPPLWGPASFNTGAGMAHINRMTGFVMYNMPQNAPGTLSLQEAYDISGYVLTHKRPSFHRNRSVEFPAEPARYF
jgi:thiosulfate dehydrogenase